MKLVARVNPRRQLHVVLDNSSTHGTPEVMAWLAKNARIHSHCTPTSASWLNQAEGTKPPPNVCAYHCDTVIGGVETGSAKLASTPPIDL
jgi:hypothetical protein